MTSQLSTQYSPSNVAGVVVSEALSGSPADNAGLQQDDIITALGGYSVQSLSDLSDLEAILGSGTVLPIDFVDPSEVAMTAFGTPPALDNYEFFYR